MIPQGGLPAPRLRRAVEDQPGILRRLRVVCRHGIDGVKGLPIAMIALADDQNFTGGVGIIDGDRGIAYLGRPLSWNPTANGLFTREFIVQLWAIAAPQVVSDTEHGRVRGVHPYSADDDFDFRISTRVVYECPRCHETWVRNSVPSWGDLFERLLRAGLAEIDLRTLSRHAEQ